MALSNSQRRQRVRKVLVDAKGKPIKRDDAAVREAQKRNAAAKKVRDAKARQTGPTRSSIGKVSGPASSPKRPPAPKPKGPVRPSIGKVSGPASSPRRPADTQSRPTGSPRSGSARPQQTGPVRPSIGKVSGPASSPKRPPAPKPPKPPAAPPKPPKPPATPPKGVLGQMRSAVGGAMRLAGPGMLAYDVIRNKEKAWEELKNFGAAKPKDNPRSQGVATSWQGPNPPRRPAPSPTPSPSPSPRPSGGGGGSRPSPSPSPRPSGGGGGGGGSSSRPAPTPAPSPKPEASKGGGAYGADGKQLYMAHKKSNPLMKRTFGYQTGEGPKKKDGDKGPVSGVGPVASGDKYAAKIGQNRGSKSGGRAAMAGSKSGPVTAQAKKEQSIMERIAEMKKRGMK